MSLSARRVVLGPFVIGGGLALALLSGSVAVAATVITASAVGFHDLAPHPHPSVPAALGPPPAVTTGARPPAAPTVAAPRPPATGPDAVPPAGAAPTPSATSRPSRSGSAAPTGTAAPSSAPQSSVARPVASPAGNALIWVAGYDQAGVIFGYAADAGAAAGAHRYFVSSPVRYHAELAQGVTITSGGTICPPAGTVCNSGQLIAAADTGFYAEVAIDSDGRLASVSERDNTHSFGPRPSGSTTVPAPTTSTPTTAPAPAPTPTGTTTPTAALASPSPSGRPTATVTAPGLR